MACLHCISWRNGWIKLNSQIVVAWKIINFILVTLTPFSRLQKGSDCWIMACLHAICWMNGWILTKLAQLYCWDKRQELIRFFVTLIPFSRLHKGYDFRKWLVSTLSHWGMDEFWPNVHIGIVTLSLLLIILTICLFKLVGGHTFSSENTVLVFSDIIGKVFQNVVIDALFEGLKWHSWSGHQSFLHHYPIYPKYSDISTPYHTGSKSLTRTLYYPMLCLNIAGS